MAMSRRASTRLTRAFCAFLAITGCVLAGSGALASAASVDEKPVPAWYLTFDGDASDPSDHANNVHSYDATGQLVEKAVLTTGTGDPSLSELRGMLLGTDGSLYVANATKSDSAILRYQPPTAAGGRDPVPPDGIFASGTPTNPGLDHPYGLAGNGAGDLLVSSQDTADVTTLDATGTPKPSAAASSWWAEHYPKVSFPAGTLVPSAVDVPAADGGLSAPRGIVTMAAAAPGLDGTLYVADNSAQAVRSYDAVTGEFLGDVLTAKNGDIGNPVGLTINNDELYVSSEGTNNVVGLSLATGKTREVVPEKLGDAHLDHPSGLAFGADGRLYVASRIGEQILAYTLDNTQTKAKTGEVFIDKLPHQPEQILPLPTSDPTETGPTPTPSPQPSNAGLTSGGAGPPTANTALTPPPAQLAATGTTPASLWWAASFLAAGILTLGIRRIACSIRTRN